jgi:Ribosomal protein L7/L12 C-terminal domain
LFHMGCGTTVPVCGRNILTKEEGSNPLINMAARIVVYKDKCISIVGDDDRKGLFTAEGGRLISTDNAIRLGSGAVQREFSWEDVKQALYTLAFGVPWEMDVETYIRTNNRVGAIRLVREKMGLGLKEAKDWVDERYPYNIKHF